MITSGTLLCLFGYNVLYYTPSNHLSEFPHASIPERPLPARRRDTQKPLSVVPEYTRALGNPDGHEHAKICFNKFGTGFVGEIADNVTEYCSSNSWPNLSCFHGAGTTGMDHDMMCVAKNVVLHGETGQFALDCDTTRTSKYLPDVDGLLKQFSLEVEEKSITGPLSPLQDGKNPTEQTNYTILVRRQEYTSFWDSLMEVFSMMLSVDVLRMRRLSRSDSDGSYNAPGDMPRTQVIILDDLPKGPVYDLWSFFAGSAPIRLSDAVDNLTEYETLSSPHTAIIPLPGHSSPLSRIEQDSSDCHGSALARIFAKRVRQFYGVHPDGEHSVAEVTRITIIDRKDAQAIQNIDLLLEAVHSAFPRVVAQAVDFAAIPMADQLQIVLSTDVLVGVHGAGLSHILFMHEGRGAVIGIEPAAESKTPRSSRYKNLAAIMGQRYFEAESRSALPDPAEQYQTQTGREVESELRKRSNHDDGLVVNEADFIPIVRQAIEALTAKHTSWQHI